ncbi:MAG: phage tail protein [Alcaligenaceae bacterium]|nr:phage tail protein [Alcaligenaceae bacterium]
MLKPNEIREIITRSNQYLRDNPDKMQVFIDAGHIACRGAKSLSYEYQYTLNIIVQDFSAHADLIILPLLIYLRTNQPELFENKDKAKNLIRFDIEFLNQECIDMSIQVDLTERVIVSQPPGESRLKAEHVPEPEHDELPNTPYHIDIYNRTTNEHLGTVDYPAWQETF